MSTWMFDYELGCNREPAPDLVPSIQTIQCWEVKARSPVDYTALKGGMHIHMGNVSGRETDKSEFEFMQDDPRQDWPNMQRWWRPLRNGIVKGEYLLKIVPIDGTTSTLYYDDEAGTSWGFSVGNFWRELYAPPGESFDSAGGRFIYLRGNNPSSDYMVRGLYDVFIANNDGTGNPKPGTTVLMRWQVSINRQHLYLSPDIAQAARNPTTIPHQIEPETCVSWAGPPLVRFQRDDYQYVYHNYYFYDVTGGGDNFETDWYHVFISEAQGAYGGYDDGGTLFTVYRTYYDSRDQIMVKVEYVSGDNVMEVNYGDTALGEWVGASNLNIVQIIDAVAGEYASVSGVFDITVARNMTPGSPYPYVLTPLPGSEQRRRIKFVTEYVADQADASNPLPDLSPPYDPDYPASSFQPFEITLRTTAPGEAVTLPFASDDVDLYGPLGIAVTVDWGDGSTDVILMENQAESTHSYASAGDHEVSIVGLMEGWQYDLLPASEALKLIEVRAWGTCGLRSCYHMFYGCSNMTVTATDAPDLTRVGNVAGMFFGCTSLVDANFVAWQPRLVKFAAEMFRGCTLVNGDVSAWGMGNLEDATGMFRDAPAIDPDVSAWNIFDCQLLDNMFTGSGLTTENYDLLLNAWSQIEYLTFYRTLGVDVPYTIAVSQGAHDYLTGTVWWTLDDAGGV